MEVNKTLHVQLKSRSEESRKAERETENIIRQSRENEWKLDRRNQEISTLKKELASFYHVQKAYLERESNFKDRVEILREREERMYSKEMQKFDEMKHSRKASKE